MGGRLRPFTAMREPTERVAGSGHPRTASRSSHAVSADLRADRYPQTGWRRDLDRRWSARSLPLSRHAPAVHDAHDPGAIAGWSALGPLADRPHAAPTA